MRPTRSSGPAVDTVVGDRVVRFDRVERWLHWVNALLVLTLVATGSTLYIGALSGLIGRRTLVEGIHLWAGLALPVPFALAFLGPWGAGLRRDVRRLGRFLAVDWLWLRRRLRRSGSLRIGKFNGGQKVNAVLVAGTLPVMLGTGLLLHWHRSLPDAWRTGATFVHDWGYLGLSLLVLGHIAKALADPVALGAMRHGRVPLDRARAEHPRWHAELVGAGAVVDGGAVDGGVPDGAVAGAVVVDGVEGPVPAPPTMAAGHE